VDFEAIRHNLEGRCFICEFLAGNPEFAHVLVYEDEDAVAFLNKYPALYGYVLVAPREHREQVTGDFSTAEYLRLQAVVHRVGEAVRRSVPTERLYILSLGSQQGNRHVHWHVAPLPPAFRSSNSSWQCSTRTFASSSRSTTLRSWPTGCAEPWQTCPEV